MNLRKEGRSNEGCIGASPRRPGGARLHRRADAGAGRAGRSDPGQSLRRRPARQADPQRRLQMDAAAAGQPRQRRRRRDRSHRRAGDRDFRRPAGAAERARPCPARRLLCRVRRRACGRRAPAARECRVRGRRLPAQLSGRLGATEQLRLQHPAQLRPHRRRSRRRRHVSRPACKARRDEGDRNRQHAGEGRLCAKDGRG